MHLVKGGQLYCGQMDTWWVQQQLFEALDLTFGKLLCTIPAYVTASAAAIATTKSIAPFATVCDAGLFMMLRWLPAVPTRASHL